MSESDPTKLIEDLTLLTPPPSEPAGGTEGSVEHGNAPILIGVGVFLLVALAAVLCWKLWYARREARREAAHLLATRELAQWSQLTDEQGYRIAVAEISGTLRRFVEIRFGIPASTRSTEQFLAEQRRSRAIPQQYMPFWDEFLDRGDIVKYAGAQPSTAEFRQLLDAAMQFVSSAGSTSQRAR